MFHLSPLKNVMTGIPMTTTVAVLRVSSLNVVMENGKLQRSVMTLQDSLDSASQIQVRHLAVAIASATNPVVPRPALRVYRFRAQVLSVAGNYRLQAIRALPPSYLQAAQAHHQ